MAPSRTDLTNVMSSQGGRAARPGQIANEIGYAPAERLGWRPNIEPVDHRRPLRVICIGAGLSGIYGEA